MAQLAALRAAAGLSRLEIPGLCQQLCGLHTSTGLWDARQDDDTTASSSSGSSGGGSNQPQDEAPRRRRGKEAMPSEVDIDRMFLRYNRRFKMDESRTWKIGHIAALELRARTEFKKLLAKQRLDAADTAVSGESLPSLEEQMIARLAQMEAAFRGAAARR